MELTFYGGVNEIGGNKFLLCDGKTKIFLDFGMSFGKTDIFFEFPLLQPTNINDLLKTDLIPDLKGLYRYYSYEANYDDTGPISITERPERIKYDGVLLTHAHMDHYGYLGLLREDIPIFSSKTTNKIIELYERAGRTGFNVNVRHLDFKNLTVNTEKKIRDFLIKRYDVDHSVLGASSYYIQGEKSLVYTGDFRLHGIKKTLSEDFLKKTEKEDVDYLLCEGTKLGKITNESEKAADEKVLGSEDDVMKKCIEIVNAEENIIIYDASQADLERVKILFEVAKKTGRKLLIDSKKAFLILNLNEDEKLENGLPQIKDFQILLGRSKLGANTKKYRELTANCPGFYLETFKEGRKNHEKVLINDESIPDDQFVWGSDLKKQILKDSNKYIIYTSSGPLLLLHCKMRNISMSGTYIYGKAEPFNEEMEFTFTRLLNWLKLCNLKLEYAHTSGHCFPNDLKRAIEVINPENVIPIHTEHPEEFKNIIPKGVNLIKPSLNKTITF